MNGIKVGMTIKCANKFGNVVEGKVREIYEKDQEVLIQTRKGYGPKFIYKFEEIVK